jgi:hypothetical protein
LNPCRPRLKHRKRPQMQGKLLLRSVAGPTGHRR